MTEHRTSDAPDVVQLSTHVAYRNRWMTVREDQVRHADGSEGLYAVVEKPDFAVIVPVHDGGVFLVEQYRYPVQGRYWELPQGSLPAPAAPDSMTTVAASELAEETGLRAGTVQPLGVLHEAYGFATQRAHVFAAMELTVGKPDREETESDMRCDWFSLPQMWSLVAAGRFTDAPSLAAVLLAQRQGLLDPSS